jgi:hypothetical protein
MPVGFLFTLNTIEVIRNYLPEIADVRAQSADEFIGCVLGKGTRFLV